WGDDPVDLNRSASVAAPVERGAGHVAVVVEEFYGRSVGQAEDGAGVAGLVVGERVLAGAQPRDVQASRHGRDYRPRPPGRQRSLRPLRAKVMMRAALAEGTGGVHDER